MKLSKCILVICLLFFIAGCGEDPVSRGPHTAAKKVRPKKSAPAKVVAEEMSSAEAYVYSPIGQRDPFESLLKKEQESRKTTVPRTPLEKFDLGQFRIQALLVGKGAPRAMVSAPDGKNYILKPGLKIGKNNGIIRDITKTSIIVEESTFDLAGNLIKGIQSISVPEKKKF